MLLAAVRDDTYNVFLLLHIVAALVAFAPAFVNPFMATKLTGEAKREFVRHSVTHGRTIYAPALYATGVLGVVMILLSDEVIEFSDLWISLAFVDWIAIIGVVHGMIIPNERKYAEGDDSAEKNIQTGGMIATLLLLLMLYLMVFKPGA